MLNYEYLLSNINTIKGIGNNSPEMRALQARVKEAEEINKLHQELNGKLQKRLTEVLNEAGFSKVRRATETPANRDLEARN